MNLQLLQRVLQPIASVERMMGDLLEHMCLGLFVYNLKTFDGYSQKLEVREDKLQWVLQESRQQLLESIK